MKTLYGLLIAAVLLTLVIVYLNHRPDKYIHMPQWRPAVVHHAGVKRQKRTLPVEITGPIKYRLLKKVVPAYPEWAEEQGVMGIFQAEISVTPAGEVRSHMPLFNTTCSPELDKLAFESLKQWKFKAVSPAVGDQQGVVTFRFKLEDPKPVALPEPCKEPAVIAR